MAAMLQTVWKWTQINQGQLGERVERSSNRKLEDPAPFDNYLPQGYGGEREDGGTNAGRATETYGSLAGGRDGRRVPPMAHLPPPTQRRP